MIALRPLKVLAVDDNRTNLHILRVFIKKLGHEVLTADNGQEALDIFARERPDLILLDIMMPVLDGFEVARRIKAQQQELWVPIIFLSALNRDENLVEGLEAGGDDYLTKPINFVVLEAKMRSMQRSLMLQQRSVDALKRVQAISNNVMEAIVTINEQGEIVACNTATETLFGWPSDELLGQNVSVLMPPPAKAHHDEYLTRYRKSGIGHIIGLQREVEALRRNGNTFSAELGVSEISLEGGRLFIGVIRDITDRKRTEHMLRENARQLQAFYDQTQAEQKLAMQLMEKQLHRRGLQDPSLRYMVLPAQRFSGDIVAATRSPTGRLYILMADATGHGLSASISVLPVLAIFYRLASHNHALEELIGEINRQLHESVPVGRYVAATLCCLDPANGVGQLWNGGMPAVLMVNPEGQCIERFGSTQLPLGIMANHGLDCQPVECSLSSGNQLILCSDGLYEAENHQGAQFGEAGLLQTIEKIPPANRFDAINEALARHLRQTTASDDVSLMIVDC